MISFFKYSLPIPIPVLIKTDAANTTPTGPPSKEKPIPTPMHSKVETVVIPAAVAKSEVKPP